MSNRKQPISYKPKKRGKKGFSSTKNIVPTIVTIAAAGVICCFGYSIAKPILNNDDSVSVNGEISNNENSIVDGTTAPVGSTTDSKSTTDIVVFNGGKKTTTTAVTTKTTSKTTDKEDKNPVVHGGEGIDGLGIPSSGDDYSTGGDSSGSGSGSGYDDSYSGGSGSGSDSDNSYSGGSGSGSGSNGSYNNGDAPAPVPGVYKSVQCSVRLPESSVNDADSLRAMLKDVKSKYPNAGAVVIPMKLQGGELNYSSNAAGDAAYAVCKGSMTASEIAKIVREEGLYAYASCSLLEDHLYSSVYSNWNAGYRVEKNGVLTGDQWYDYFPDQGGQPWLDPNSDLTVAYLQNIIKELSSSGFSAVLCSDIKYPNFVQADEKYLNPDIYAKNPDALIKLANALNAAASDATDIVLDLSAYNAMNGGELVYDPSKLDVSYALLETSSGDASSVSSWASSNSGDMSVSLSYTDGSGNGHCVINY